MFKKYRNKLYCFSPPVMLATFIIEFSFAFYIILRYKTSTTKKLVVAILIALGAFQLSEYMICGGLGLTHIDWARAGYGFITLLPALGIHLVVTLADKKMPLLVGAAYFSCAVFLLFYLLSINSVSSEACYANYAVFNTQEGSGWPFGVYYYSWLFIGTWLAWHWGEENKDRQKVLRSMSLGYMAFILPTAFFNIVKPETVSAIPSIMCGFAVLLAFTLTLRVMPNAAEAKTLYTTEEELQS